MTTGTSTRGRWFAAASLGIVAVLAGLELFSGLALRGPSEGDWAAIRDHLDPELPLRIGTRWQEAAARQELLAAREPSAVGPPDLRGMALVQVVGEWGPELQADLEDLPPPEVVERFESGPLQLTTYAIDGGHALDGLVARWDDPGFAVSVDGAICRRAGDRFRCKRGSIRSASLGLEYAEVDHRARHCAVIRADEGEAINLEWSALELGNRLRGHVGFHDFNGRLRSEAPVDVRLWIDDVPTARWTLTDAQGWAPLAVTTVPGDAKVRLQLRVTGDGTWDRDEYGERKVRPVCLELRTFHEGGG